MIQNNLHHSFKSSHRRCQHPCKNSLSSPFTTFTIIGLHYKMIANE
ncbi:MULTISPECIES: hypothetical protein [Prevotella]|nr:MULTISPECIES: hypothetical protein [Prevotella]